MDMATERTPSSLEASVEAKLSMVAAEELQRSSQPFTMFRVPADIREANRTAYEPRMVSIGPYHRGGDALRTMEDHKWRYLHNFLRRGAPAGVTSSSLIREVRALEPRARACYSERPDGLDSDEFVGMLLLDGCFVLEFLFKWYRKEPDEVCDVGWGLTLIDTDLLLLENQIPFFVLEMLFDSITAGGGRDNLVRLFFDYSGGDRSSSPLRVSREIHHLLHLYYDSFVPKLSSSSSSSSGNTPTPTKKNKKSEDPAQPMVIPRAAEMSAAGVTFLRKTDARDVYDVTFDGDRGVMEIPGVEVDDMRRPLLVNLIAFEQSHGGEEDQTAGVVTSYVSLMSMLLRTAEDVELLRRLGVLDNLLADDEAAARFFSRLGDGYAMNYGGNHVFAGLYEDVRRYCGSWWHMNRAALMRDYFGNPWSAISFVVAALVVALTATQTYFAVFPRS